MSTSAPTLGFQSESYDWHTTLNRPTKISRGLMANRNSKKKAPKDFEKKQVKVGKLKPGAANRTDTSFTAKALKIKDQSIPEEHDILARRKDSLARLAVSISQLGHYSPSFRKEAVQSIARIVKELPDLQMHILSITESLVKTIVDDDHTVRQASVALWTWILKCDELKSAIGTILNLLAPFVKMGLTHLKKEICADTAKVLVCLVDECPSMIKPFLPDILVCLCRHFSGKSFENITKNNTVDLVELFNKCCRILVKTEEETVPILEYEWLPIQTRSLCLPIRKINLRPVEIHRDQVEAILKQVIPSAIQVWSHVGYLLASPSFAVSDKEEMLMFERCRNTIYSCWSLCRVCDMELNSVVPVKVHQSSSWTQLMSKFAQ